MTDDEIRATETRYMWMWGGGAAYGLVMFLAAINGHGWLATPMFFGGVVAIFAFVGRLAARDFGMDYSSSQRAKRMARERGRAA